MVCREGGGHARGVEISPQNKSAIICSGRPLRDPQAFFIADSLASGLRPVLARRIGNCRIPAGLGTRRPCRVTSGLPQTGPIPAEPLLAVGFKTATTWRSLCIGLDVDLGFDVEAAIKQRLGSAVNQDAPPGRR